MKLAPITIMPPTPVTMSTGQEPRDQISVAEACPLSSRLSKVEALGAVPGVQRLGDLAPQDVEEDVVT